MSLYALIRTDGIVGEVALSEFPVAPPLQWVDVSSLSPTPQVGWSYSGNTFSAPAAPSAPSLEQQAAAASIAGLIIGITGTLSLLPTLFPTDTATQAKLGAVVTTLAVTGSFPGGGTTYPIKDATGTWHSLNVEQYKTVVGAIGAYVAACDLIADGNPIGATSLPSNTVSLLV